MRNKQPSLFMRNVRRILLCLTILLMFENALVPAPAHALVPITGPMEALYQTLNAIKEAIGWAMEELKLTAMITQLVSMYNQFADVFNKWFNWLFDKTTLELLNDRITSEQKMREYQALIENNTRDTIAIVEAAQIAKYTPPLQPHLCRSIMVYQLSATTMDFAREVSRMIVEGMSNRARYAGTNEPLELMKDLLNRCGTTFKMGSRFEPGCYNDDTLDLRGTDGRTGEDIASHGVDAMQIFEMPMIETVEYKDRATNKTMTVRYPAPPTTDDQKFWMGAFNYYYSVVGSRPIPVGGALLGSPIGLTQRAMYNHCLANQNALVKQCADLMAFFTRPNSTDPAMATFRENQEKLCVAAQKSVKLEDRYGDCKKGLSAYEAHKIQESWCLSSNQTLALKASGATNSEANDASDLCARSSLAFSKLVDKLFANCNAAMAAMPELDACWAAADALGQGGKTAVSSSQSVPSSSMHRIRAGGKDLKAPAAEEKTKLKAMPISFDAVSPLDAVAQ